MPSNFERFCLHFCTESFVQFKDQKKSKIVASTFLSLFNACLIQIKPLRHAWIKRLHIMFNTYFSMKSVELCHVSSLNLISSNAVIYMLLVCDLLLVAIVGSNKWSWTNLLTGADCIFLSLCMLGLHVATSTQVSRPKRIFDFSNVPSHLT
jgi:hypothetical protein